MNTIELGGRVAVVTGGSGGIGATVAERLAASGARVASWDLAPCTSKAIRSIVVDVTGPDSVESAARETEREVGPIDILINSAGIAGPTAASWQYPLDAWRRVQRVNVEGTLLCCQQVIPGMISRNYGRIVNIASIAGKEGNPNAAAYSASKAAVIALTKSMGKELAGYDIAVNALTPATAETPLLQQVTSEFVDYMRSKIPRGRFVTVNEVAAIVAWMASAENSFTTAAVFDLSGGRATY